MYAPMNERRSVHENSSPDHPAHVEALEYPAREGGHHPLPEHAHGEGGARLRAVPAEFAGDILEEDAEGIPDADGHRQDDEDG